MTRLYSFYQNRIRLMSVIFFTCSILILVKMLFIQSFLASDYRETTLHAGITERSVKGNRGNISDRNGQALAETVHTYTFWVDTHKEVDIEAVVHLFSREFNQPPESYPDHLKYLTPEIAKGMFVFPEDMQPADGLEVNRLSNQILTRYFEEEWRQVVR